MTHSKKQYRASITASSHEKSTSSWLLVVSWTGMLIFAWHASTHMLGAGDLWVAMASGRHVVNHGASTVEPFSANSLKAGPTEKEVKTWPAWAQSLAAQVGMDTVRYWHPTGWINQNWLSHAFFYWLTTSLGSEEEPYLDALVYLKFAIYILTVFCLYAIGRFMGVHPSLSAAGACFALFVSRSFLAIRPADFSNMLVPVFILILVLATYRRSWMIWLIVPLTVIWGNMHGGYVYMPVMLVLFWVFNLLTLPSQRIFRTIGRKGLFHTLGAGLTAMTAMIVFNPFHLTNLTHPLLISFGRDAERWRVIREWQPAFQWDNPLGTAVPFLFLCLLLWITAAAWILLHVLPSRSGLEKKRKAEGYRWPRIPLALLAVVAVTVYMAIRSRRFIPIAAYVTCPFLVLQIQEILQFFGVTHRFAGMSQKVKTAVFGVCTGLVLLFGFWVGAKYYRIYLSPWPFDPHNDSEFMRMTASYREPLLVSEFMRLNKLNGKMFNHWTSGGSLVWGQEPDLETGRTSVQLFIDGRAQAAYKRQVMEAWDDLWFAGDVGDKFWGSGKRPSTADFTKMGAWVDKTLKRKKIWLAQVPERELNGYFYWALGHTQTWRIVYVDNQQKLLADLAADEGKRLFSGIEDGRVLFPNNFTRLLNQGHSSLAYGQNPESREKGLNLVFQAYEEKPSPAPVIAITRIAIHDPRLIPEITRFCETSFQDFQANKLEYAKQGGYGMRLEAMGIVCDYLRQEAQKRQDEQTARMHAERAAEYREELEGLRAAMLW